MWHVAALHVCMAWLAPYADAVLAAHWTSPMSWMGRVLCSVISKFEPEHTALK